MRIRFTLNGRAVEADVPPYITLLDMLREHFRITSVKRGCEVGECGACTVLLNGKPVNSCLILAPKVDGMDVTTVEGLVRDGKPHPIQEAFVEEFAVQCGYCSPGFILTAKALLDRVPKPKLEEIKENLSGNICRCGAYQQIINAILKASERIKG